MQKVNTETPRARRKAVWAINVAMAVVASAVMYFLFPHMLQQIIFFGIMRNGWYIIPGLALLAYVAKAVWRYFKYADRQDSGIRPTEARRGLVIAGFLATVYVGYAFTLSLTTDWLTYHTYARGAEQLTRLIPADTRFLRFTPLQNACVDMANAVNTTGEEIDCRYTFGFMTPHGFGYASPLQPTGVVNTFTQQNSGYMVLDDSTGASDDPKKRIHRIHLPQKYGIGVEWFTNLESYVLPRVDFFASYEKPHALVLDPAKPNELTAVVPKIKYGWLWRLPYWGGVVLVHHDGKIEDLSAAKAMADPRLKGKWIYPLELSKYYVQIQNYALGHGILSDQFNWPGQLKVEHLSGRNQYPFLTQGNDNVTYHVVGTVGKGAARGLYRMYFVNSSTGARSYFEFDSDAIVYGAEGALARLTNVPTYNWYHHDDKGGSGTAIGVEPVYVVRPGDGPKQLHWKFTITNRSYSGISATAIMDARKPDDIMIFKEKERSGYETWLAGGNADMVSAKPGEDFETKALMVIKHLREEIDRLEAMVKKAK